VALGVLGVAALIWFLLAAFVASRWPALFPVLGKLRTPPARMALVGVVAALVLAAAFASRPALARSRSHDDLGRRRPDRRLVIHSMAAGQPQFTMVHVGSPCAHGHMDAETEADVEVNAEAGEAADAYAESQEAIREAQEEARQAAEEAMRDAEEQARDAQQEARERAQEARERAQERVEAARERAHERAEEARGRAEEAAQRAQERAQRAQERAQEIAEREMERAQEVMERMGDEMESTRDAVNEGLEFDSDASDGDRRHSRTRMESFLERQAQKVERLGREMAEQLRGLASKFGEDEGGDDEDDHDEEDSVDL
jgi:ElaB/YqjD/DUF883 family membrane-anchored ribosome-binding protein